ncbi:transmembrane and death domain protein 1 [Ornithorhynchus anatinus]|uniref:transmembrane and death domain protein 1 n=1 Tax=Ornithorhynchus anatinus TaxID=9258 RepID=UPI0010A885FD|nr:transmembrane and death domain protein 1 [Ornithorhynchus anatinus]
MRALSLALGVLCALGAGAGAGDALGPHLTARLAALLSPEECEAFRVHLAAPEPQLQEARSDGEDRDRHRDRARDRREARAAHDQDQEEEVQPGRAGCRESLAGRLDAEGPGLTWDRVARALRRSGRPDVARELGKTLNQATALELRRYGRRYLKASTPTPKRPPRAPPGRPPPRRPRAPSWDELEPVVERPPPGRYERSPLGWVEPLALGLFSGLVGALGVGALLVPLTLWLAGGDGPGPALEAMDPGSPEAPLLGFPAAGGQ